MSETHGFVAHKLFCAVKCDCFPQSAFLLDPWRRWWGGGAGDIGLHICTGSPDDQRAHRHTKKWGSVSSAAGGISLPALMNS